jgi:anti-sigma-K factor RskA
MELVERVGNLETDMRDVRDRLTRIEVRLDTFQSTFATKEDMHREFNLQTWRIIGAVLAAGGLFFAAAKLIN